MNNMQIFQTASSERWLKLKWLSRAIFACVILAVISVIITITSRQYPKLPDLSRVPSFSKKDIDKIKNSTKYKEFKIQKAQLVALERDKLQHKLIHVGNKHRINAGFFVYWDAQSRTSLDDHINQMDMVIPEFFFLKKGADTVYAQTDTSNLAVLKLVRQHHKKLIATVKNFIGNNWDGSAVHYIISSEKHKSAFIANLVKQMQKYHIDGINVDFEELAEKTNEPITLFQKQLYEALHSKGFIVTQDVTPNNEDYDIQALNRYNDYIFLMAYDQHTEESNAGDISHQRWVEEQLDKICRSIPSEKVILAIAGYGQDWPENNVGSPVTYQQAISTAQQNHAIVKFNPESANLHYSYTDNRNSKHEVYFTDAATNFNIIRMADDWETGGIALWRLGSEDPRLWKFFSKDLSSDSLKKSGFNAKLLTKIELNNRIDYSGDGEILDLISSPKDGKLTVKIDPATQMIVDQQYIELPTKYVIKKFGQSDKKVVLTFDDGPDPAYTPQVMDILKREHVPATFFVVGMMAESNIPILKEIFDRGYEIGNHTFFHPDLSTVSSARVLFELNATRKLIECITGRSTILFRAPFNADAEPQTVAEVLPVAQSRRESYINVGESIDPRDWEPNVTADSIVARVIAQKDLGSIVLLHDAGGNRSATIAALPRIIEYYKKHGYQFTTVSNILGKTKAEIMPAIVDDADSGLTGSADRFFIETLFYSNKVLYYIFIIAIGLAFLRICFITKLALKNCKLETHNPEKAAALPPVSIIIPAFNEEVTAVKTIENLLKLNYPQFELLFIDDGSTDNTFARVNAAFEGNKKVKIFSKPNGGKASALNYGLLQSSHDHVICIDADTHLHPNAVTHLMACFVNDKIAAVAGTVKVGNEGNILTKWQSIEYITSQNMDRRAFDLLNTITVVPGAIGAFSKEAINIAGGFTNDTLAEDCDLTMRILKAGYVVKNCAKAIAYTEAPESLSMLLKQRFRWSFGVMQSFYKNRNALFNKKYKYFGMIGMPNILIFQIILPLFAPLADLFMLIALMSGVFNLFNSGNINLESLSSTFSISTSLGQVLIYYIAFIVIDTAFALLAFTIEGEKYNKLVYLIPQRFIWRQLMYYVLFKSIRKALKGELNGWGVLKRNGTVRDIAIG